MSPWQLRLATAGILIVVAVITFKLFGSTPGDDGSSPVSVSSSVQGEPLPIPDPDEISLQSEEGYLASATTSRDILPDAGPPQIDDDDELTEDECIAFLGHVQGLHGDRGGMSDSKEALQLCGLGDIDPAFARCAMNKSTSAALAECVDDDRKPDDLEDEVDLEELLRKAQEEDDEEDDEEERERFEKTKDREKPLDPELEELLKKAKDVKRGDGF